MKMLSLDAITNKIFIQSCHAPIISQHEVLLLLTAYELGNAEELAVVERELLASWRNKWDSNVLQEICYFGRREPHQVLIEWHGARLFLNVPKDNKGRTPLY